MSRDFAPYLKLYHKGILLSFTISFMPRTYLSFIERVLPSFGLPL